MFIIFANYGIEKKCLSGRGIIMDKVFRGTCKAGKIVIHDYHFEKWFLNLCNLEGKECEFIARKKSNQKSNKQNRYYRKIVVGLIAQHCGERPERQHGILQLKFFKETDENGIEYIKSTKLSEWKTVEWENKMSEIRQWASEFLNLYIPKPNEVDFY